MAATLLLLLALCLTCGQTEAGADMLGSAYFHLDLKVSFYILPFLNYSSMMLEPHLDAVGLEQHYEGHHEQYRREMNKVIDEWREEEPDNGLNRESVLTILQKLDEVPDKYKKRVGHQAGGYVNHCFYFGVMSPNLDSETREPTGDIAKEIEVTFGGFKEFQSAFERKVASVYGSGYVWLVRNKEGGLEIFSTLNEFSPVSWGLNPILVVDLWEHAYQTKHVYHRQQYVSDWWSVVDWDKVASLDQWWRDLAEKRRAEESKEDKDEL